MTTRRGWGAAVLAGALAFAAGGCADDGKNEVVVSGAVSIDGKSIPQGTIRFIAEDGQTPTGGGPIKDGKYTAKVPPGKKKVTVLGNEVVGTEPSLKGVPDSAPREVLKTLTPLEYNAAHVTPLRADITGDQEGLDFELTKSVAKKK